MLGCKKIHFNCDSWRNLEATAGLNPDNKLQYINTQSNYPPNVIRQIPKTIEQRLSNHSSNEHIFTEAKKPYEKALKESGYNVELSYKPTNPKNTQPKNRKRNITWFNQNFENFEFETGYFSSTFLPPLLGGKNSISNWAFKFNFVKKKMWKVIQFVLIFRNFFEFSSKFILNVAY